MNKKIVEFIKRGANAEVLAYFGSKAYRASLNAEEEKLLLTCCSDEVFLSYINRFELSVEAEKKMIDMKNVVRCEAYIKKYGLCENVQRYLLDRNNYDMARVFFKYCNFVDEEYLLGSRNEEMVRIYLEYHALSKEEYILYLLSYRDLSILCDYINKGRVVGDIVKDRIISTENATTFKALVYHYNKVLREESTFVTDFNWLKEKVSAYGLNAKQQVRVLESGDRMLIEAMMSSVPLEKEAQAYLFENDLPKSFIQVHVVSLYGVGGYRFEKEHEEMLFKLLNKRSFDDCLISMRYYDTLAIVKFCSDDYVFKFVKTTWLCDEAQIYLINNKKEYILKEFVARFTKDHGMCWQAEVLLVQRNLKELVGMYIKVHTMCDKALQILKRTQPLLFKKYHEIHDHDED